jgi:DNA-binding NarL/FixJ family response regulator
MVNLSVLLKDLNVLIAEDQTFMVELVRGVLWQNGCRKIAVAENGVKAVETLERDQIDLVICDINMDPLNGLQFLAAVRAGLTDAAVDLPIIMLTGHTEDPMIEASRLLKANGFLGKPVSAADLTSEINRVFSTPAPFEAPRVDKTAVYHAIEAARAQVKAEEHALGLDLAKINQAESGSQKTANSNEEWVDIADLEVGHFLVEDVISLNGQKMLSAGTALDNKQVELIKRDGARLGLSALKVRL